MHGGGVNASAGKSSQAPPGIIGGRRPWTVSMICSGSTIWAHSKAAQRSARTRS
jgi:hypothetical protein